MYKSGFVKKVFRFKIFVREIMKLLLFLKLYLTLQNVLIRYLQITIQTKSIKQKIKINIHRNYLKCLRT